MDRLPHDPLKVLLLPIIVLYQVEVHVLFNRDRQQRLCAGKVGDVLISQVFDIFCDTKTCGLGGTVISKWMT